jgi:RAD51-like protein 2
LRFCHFPFFCQAGGQSAWDMLNEERFSSSITTSCVDLDNILGGGINCKEVTEIGD